MVHCEVIATIARQADALESVRSPLVSCLADHHGRPWRQGEAWIIGCRGNAKHPARDVYPFYPQRSVLPHTK
jgi:hypothetical protein